MLNFFRNTKIGVRVFLAVLIPAAALIPTGDGHQVMIANGRRAERRAVRTGVADAGTIEITSTISLSTSPERLRAIANQPPRNIRLLLGYSGWGPGQLAQEMARGAWLHTSADPKLVFETPPDDIWDRAMKSLGINPRDLFTGRGVN